MVMLGRLFSWRDALVNVQPDTFIRWHCKGFRLLWRWKSRPTANPQGPAETHSRDGRRESDLGRGTHRQRVAAEADYSSVPATVGKYLHRDGPVRTPDPKQRWLTFVRNHAKVIVACDFFVMITAAFRTLYIFVFIEIESRKILHQNVTVHPTADWTLQQLREALPGGHPSASSSMIAIASLRRNSIKVARTWGCEFCGRQCEPPSERGVRAAGREPLPGVS
jgi:hypothetical protein